MSSALAAAGGSTELGDVRGYEDSGLHVSKAAGAWMAALHWTTLRSCVPPHRAGHSVSGTAVLSSPLSPLGHFGPSGSTFGVSCTLSLSQGLILHGQLQGALQQLARLSFRPAYHCRCRLAASVNIAAGQANSGSGPLLSHLEHVGSAGDRYRAADAAEAPYRAADFRRNSSGRALPAYAASSSGGSSYSSGSRSRRDCNSTPERATGSCPLFFNVAVAACRGTVLKSQL